ncbi:MAG: hypothetical protein NWF11_02615 [Candidatus Bathyarchaeota archaeon]|nr:hypothetical protein [Candidatus Bathyarchaeota archaeon]
MLEHNLEDDLSDFDLKHFCDGNPIYCYYFRLPQLELKKTLSTTEGHSPSVSPGAEIVQWEDWTPAKRLTEDILSTRNQFRFQKK